MSATRRLATGLVALALVGTGSGSELQEPAGAQDLEAWLARIRHTWTGEELPLEALAIEVDRSPRRSVSAEEAAEDVERLFRLLAQGWSAYGMFDEGGRFDAAREDLLASLQRSDWWETDTLASLVRARLDFVRDCHTRLGDVPFGEHRALWMVPGLELERLEGAWRFEADGVDSMLVSVDGEDPDGYLLRSLDADGRPVHRLGLLSATRPGPLTLGTQSAVGSGQREVELERSDFDHWADEVFGEDRIGGIGVLRIRGFGDADPEALQRWVASAERYRDEPCVVVDLRGNRGGNERWASDWVERLTGVRPTSSFVFSELESRTTMAGRLNAHLWWDHIAPGVEAIGQGTQRYRAALARFAPGGASPRWTGPFHPRPPRIPNDTTVVVVTNGQVASAGEGFVMRMRQAENVFVVGENTHGALTFGNVSLHQLPRSGLKLWLPINLNLFADGSFREEVGLEPDWWVPAGDAVNHAVAALRAGTIPTVRPLPPEVLAAPFVPEDPRRREHARVRRRLGLVALGVVAGAVVARRMRRRSSMALSLGLVWMALGLLWAVLGRARGPLLTDAGLAFVAFGVAALAVTIVLRLARVTVMDPAAPGR